MKNAIIKTSVLAILVTTSIFSCKKKDDTNPTPTPQANNTNTLALNSWKVTNNGVSTTYIRLDTVKGGLSGPGNPQILYVFFNNAAADHLSFTFKGDTAPASGIYKVVGGLVENADEVVVGATLGAGAVYSVTTFNSTIKVTNSGREILIEANEISMGSFSGKTCKLSANLKK